jgi:hypothetical protein
MGKGFGGGLFSYGVALRRNEDVRGSPSKACRDQTSRPTEHDRSDQRLKRYARTLVTRCPKKHRCRRWFTLGCTGTGRPRAGQSAAHVSAFLV